MTPSPPTPLLQCIEEIIERQQAEKEGEKASESSNDEPEDEEDVQTKPPKRKRAKTTKTTGGDGDKPGRVCFCVPLVDCLLFFAQPYVCMWVVMKCLSASITNPL